MIGPSKLRELRGNMGCVRRCVGCVGQNFYVGCMGQNIFYVGHNFYVSCVGQVYFMRRPLRESKFFAGVNFWGVLGQGLQKSQLALSQ